MVMASGEAMIGLSQGIFPSVSTEGTEPYSEPVDCLYLTTEGFFGSMAAICAGTLFVFISFGVFLQATGGDQRFMDIALSVAGHKPGGPAQWRRWPPP